MSSPAADWGIHLQQQCCALLDTAGALLDTTTKVPFAPCKQSDCTQVTVVGGSSFSLCKKFYLEQSRSMGKSKTSRYGVLGLRYDGARACPLTGGVKISSRKVTNDPAKTYAVHF